MTHSPNKRTFVLQALEPRVLLSGTDVAVAASAAGAAVISAVEMLDEKPVDFGGGEISYDAEGQVGSIFDFDSDESSADASDDEANKGKKPEGAVASDVPAGPTVSVSGDEL